MRRFFFTILFIAGIAPVIANEAPVPKSVPDAGMTINDCLAVLTGLSRLDDDKLVPAGRADFPPALRDAQTHDLFVLSIVQQETSSANRRAQLEIGKGEPIKPGSVEELKFQERMSEYTARPCTVQLDRLRKEDLLKGGPIPGTIRALLWKITD